MDQVFEFYQEFYEEGRLLDVNAYFLIKMEGKR